MNFPSDLTQVTEMVEDAYTYAYPLLVMYFTQQRSTTMPIDPAAAPSSGAPLNVFYNMTSFPDDTFKEVVRPNVETLYSSAWLNLSTGPLVLKLPSTNARYYLMPVLSAWTDVIASPGMRTNPTTPSTAAQDFLLVGPGWKAPVPPCFDSAHVIRIPTSMAWINGRTKALKDPPEDLEKVHQIQAQYQLVPLALYLQDPTGDYHPDLDLPVNPSYPTEKPPVMVAELSEGMAIDYFNLFARLLVHNPPLAGDEQMVDTLEQLGIFPGQPVDWSDEPPDVQQAIITGVQNAINAIANPGGTPVNGWSFPNSGIGNYQPPGKDHDNYLVRAQIARGGLGANLPEDAVYLASCAPLTGSYILEFTPGAPSLPKIGQLPPVNPAAFWSLTAYVGDYLIPNNAKKYSISSEDDLWIEGDVIPIYIQETQPEGDRGKNWLPVGKDAFNLTLRLYWPDQSVLNNEWAPPKLIQGAVVAQGTRKTATAA